MSFDLIEQPTDNVRYECEECGTHNPNKHESWCEGAQIGSWSDEYIDRHTEANMTVAKLRELLAALEDDVVLMAYTAEGVEESITEIEDEGRVAYLILTES